MKRIFRLTAAILSLCMVLSVLPPAGFAAGGTTHTLADMGDLQALLKDASVQDGDIIQLSGSATVADQGGGDAPWIIGKSVTIQGGIINVRSGGILLDADVTFRNTTLSFAGTMRNAVIANGHALTLDNVSCGNFSFNLFCGGLIPSEAENLTLPAPGSAGTITVRGATTLQKDDTFGSGNLYAGNLCMGGIGEDQNGPADNGAPNTFSGRAVITIEDRADRSALGTIYACGAQQRIPVGAASGKRTYPDPENYRVSGSVEISGKLPNVNGAGADRVDVVYSGDDTEAGRTVNSVSNLTVSAGNLKLEEGSTFKDAAGALSVASGAKLNVAAMAESLAIGSFSGGGSLVLGRSQRLLVDGSVSGETSVEIDGFSGSAASAPLTEGQVYIQAPSSTDTSFALVPNAAHTHITLERDGNGVWSVAAGDDRVLVKSFRFDDKQVEMAPDTIATEEAELRMTAETGEDTYAELALVPLEIFVDGDEVTPTVDEDGYETYETAELSMYVAENTLYVTVKDQTDRRYTIEIRIPGTHTVSGQPLRDSAVLTVGSPAADPVPVPEANTGLKWTGSPQTGVSEGTGYTLAGHIGTDVGSYTARASLSAGYQWEDGTTDAKDIPWRIDKADGPAAPGGLSASAPTSENGADGKITGTTAAMEYAQSPDFSDGRDCGEGETTGLSAGTYYLRVKATATHEAGSAGQITVPAYGAPAVVSIAVNSTGHKTVYTVGDALDVSELTIAVAYSDGTERTLPVTAEMVSGFDSGEAVESLTLTVHYEGKTAAYTIRVEGDGQPDPGPHLHQWAAQWTASDTHHWRDCAVAGCPLADSQKDGYGPHTAGEWVVEQAATATQSGSRYKACAVCGHVMERETIPATGGGSSSRPSGSGSSISSGSSGNTSTSKNPDGSTTTTSTNPSTGAVTETTRRPDGSQTVVESRKDGTVVTTEREADGSTVQTLERPDGSSETAVKRADGVSAQIRVDREGRTEAAVTISSKAAGEAQRGGGVLTLPLPALTATRDGAASVTVNTGNGQPVRVEIPLTRPAPGIVAVVVGADGRETIARTSVPTAEGIALTVSDKATVKLVDNDKSFSDTRGHWAEEAIRFVSARELFTGSGGTAFSPNAPMSRGMMMTVLARLDGVDTSGGASWYEKGMAYAVAQGISDGGSPERGITREQLVTMLYRYAGSPAGGGALRFTDADAVSGYALEAVRWAVEQGLLSGYQDGRLAPKDPATRAQVAAILTRYIGLMQQ